ncbi:hypothetical protein BDZ89DRAFT_2804 [Hymenopellis radicata]|nr:hypothetical protein BDZ89DRAFT_2804 [Hymenopellis radicata]
MGLCAALSHLLLFLQYGYVSQGLRDFPILPECLVSWASRHLSFHSESVARWSTMYAGSWTIVGGTVIVCTRREIFRQ